MSIQRSNTEQGGRVRALSLPGNLMCVEGTFAHQRTTYVAEYILSHCGGKWEITHTLRVRQRGRRDRVQGAVRDALQARMMDHISSSDCPSDGFDLTTHLYNIRQEIHRDKDVLSDLDADATWATSVPGATTVRRFRTGTINVLRCARVGDRTVYAHGEYLIRQEALHIACTVRTDTQDVSVDTLHRGVTYAVRGLSSSSSGRAVPQALREEIVSVVRECALTSLDAPTVASLRDKIDTMKGDVAQKQADERWIRSLPRRMAKTPLDVQALVSQPG